MSSAQGHSTPTTLTEGPEEHVEGQQIRREDRVERHQERLAEPTPEPRPEPRPEPELQQEPKNQREPVPQREPQPVASTSFIKPPDQPPEIPPKDRDLENRLSVDPTSLHSISTG